RGARRDHPGISTPESSVRSAKGRSLREHTPCGNTPQSDFPTPTPETRAPGAAAQHRPTSFILRHGQEARSIADARKAGESGNLFAMRQRTHKLNERKDCVATDMAPSRATRATRVGAWLGGSAQSSVRSTTAKRRRSCTRQTKWSFRTRLSK